MNEENRKKREWIKTAAIIFLAVMLVLTFFSQTIMNYSLPEVATQYVSSGTITAKIRGSGTVESGDPYEVKIEQSRKIASIEVRTGDIVEKGTILMYLEDVEESEVMTELLDALKAAEDALEKAQDDYNMHILDAAVTAYDVQAANRGISVDSYRRQITNYQNALRALENEMKPLEKKVAELNRDIADIDKQVEIENSLDNAAQKREEAAKNAMDNAQENLINAENYYNSVSNGDAAIALSAKENRDNAQKALNDAIGNYHSAVNDNNARKASPVYANLDVQKASKTADVHGVERELELKKEEYDNKKAEFEEEFMVDINNIKGIDTFLDAIEKAEEDVAKAQEKVDEQKEKDIGSTITAPISGTITNIPPEIKSGNDVEKGTVVATMQPEGKGYTVSFSVTNEQARRLSVGDQAEMVNSWMYSDLKVTLANIKPDTTDPGKKKLLTFDVEGDATPGQTLNLSVGQKSANYDLIVPNSAIREDNNGKFILIVESKSSPLGTRYTASRVDVEVLASDDTQSAISGALYGYEFVITTSTKPVEAGKLVRLANN